MVSVDQDNLLDESAPNFNGLSPEVFTAGSEILNIWNRLEPQDQEEIFPFLIQVFGYDLLGEVASDEQLRVAIDAVRFQADAVQHALQSRDARRKPQELQPDEY